MLALLLLIIGFIFYNVTSAPTTEIHSYTFTANKTEIEEVERIHKQIEETELTKKIINALKENGYSPDERILYTIYSTERNVLSITLSNFKRDDETINKMKNIINMIAKENDFNIFSIEFSETKK